jgi:predicted NBD/HSP70 family sugar kinase
LRTLSSTGSLEGLRRRNKLRVIEALSRQGTASRSELARLTGLSRTTITSLVTDLQRRGLVVEQESGDAGPEPAGRGRPPTLLRLDPSAGTAVGVYFGHDHVSVAAADLSSTVLAERRLELDVDHSATVALDAATTLVDVVLRKTGLGRGDVVGVGMGLSGPVDLDGTVGSTAILPDWVGLYAGTELSRRLDVPVVVDNDANLGALAEVSRGAGRGLTDVIYVMVSSGIGSGLILGGRLHRGATGFAGELGHVFVVEKGAVCRCGSRGCLETVASTDALLDLLRPAHGPDLTVGGMLELVAAGDRAATRVVYDSGRAVGRVLAGIAGVLDPQAIIVGGELSAAGEPLLSGIRDAIDRYAMPGSARNVEVRPGMLGDRAEVLGALALVIGDPERLGAAGLAAIPPDGPAERGAAPVTAVPGAGAAPVSNSPELTVTNKEERT